jgi:hypothetical protein
LIDVLVEVHNEETHLRDAGILWSSSILATHYLVACPATLVSLASPSDVLPAPHGEIDGLHCDHYGQDGHVKVFFYKKRKAQMAQARHL